jgi:AbrB family looped-hinge helix DNA binding protein
VAEDGAEVATERQRRAARDRIESGQPLFLADTADRVVLLQRAADDHLNYYCFLSVIQAMRSTITARGQTVVPAPIRERFQLGPSTRLEWIVEGDGTIRVVPVALDPITAFRGSGAGGGTTRLLTDRSHDRQRES